MRHCDFDTNGRPCPLNACCDEFCPYHYARVQKKFRSDLDEYTWFLEWCQTSRRWNSCLWAPVSLWRILCGIEPASHGSWICPDEMPWQPVIDGTMSLAEYWGRQKPRPLPSAFAVTQ